MLCCVARIDCVSVQRGGKGKPHSPVLWLYLCLYLLESAPLKSLFIPWVVALALPFPYLIYVEPGYVPIPLLM